jgi:hypothetical protein
MDPITQGVAGNAIWTAVMAAGRSIFPHKIKIISPRPQELLGGREPLGGGFSYAVRGTLKKLPKGHAIWVLTALGDVEIITSTQATALSYATV